ncbi:TetR/AcrR family transcriptional regulator [Adlercreutzia sp. ZJ141]|uniref:TetR/AcrR family transcriptional regulator n=1 Tax=Adlercreutzia sp. ZJ141 TaxID=2709406 RepID=UPI0013ED4AF0|nr:TetR/AcrR family transcriptional regulator [Adlercreutzia sp. ZJ141]
MQHVVDEFVFQNDEIARSIILAMNELAETHTYEEMSIRQICEKANVSRTTFYRRFDGKIEAAEWVMRRVSAIGLAQIGRTLTWHEGITMTLAATKRFAAFFRAGGEWGDSAARRIMDDFTSYHVGMFIDTVTRYKRIRLDEGLEYVLRFWVYSLCDALFFWRISDFAIPVNQMAEYLERAVPAEIHEMLQEPVSLTGDEVFFKLREESEESIA